MEIWKNTAGSQHDDYATGIRNILIHERILAEFDADLNDLMTNKNRKNEYNVFLDALASKMRTVDKHGQTPGGESLTLHAYGNGFQPWQARPRSLFHSDISTMPSKVLEVSGHAICFAAIDKLKDEREKMIVPVGIGFNMRDAQGQDMRDEKGTPIYSYDIGDDQIPLLVGHPVLYDAMKRHQEKEHNLERMP